MDQYRHSIEGKHPKPEDSKVMYMLQYKGDNIKTGKQ